MSPTTFGWLVILCPLVGCIVIAVGFREERGNVAGWIGTLAIFLAFAFAIGALISMLGRAEDSREVTSSLWNYAFTVGRRREAVDPRRSAVGPDDPDRLRSLGPDPPLLGRLPEVRSRLLALLLHT